MPLLPPLWLLPCFLLPCLWWLPSCIVTLRNALFSLINGEEGLSVPRAGLDAAATRRLYEHPGARLRSKHRGGLGLSDLFWYLLQPGADIHQEHTESGTALHTAVSSATRLLLGIAPAELAALAHEAVAWRLRTADGAGVLAARGREGSADVRAVRLRRFVFPLVARFWWSVVFGEIRAADEAAIAAVAASGTDVIDALKALKLRDMALRDGATALLQREMAARPECRAARAYAPALAAGVLTPAEAALALQGVIFHTGTVQLSDALTHLMLGLAQYEAPGDGAREPSSGWDRVAAEAAAGSDAATAAGVGAGADAGAPGQCFLDRAMHEALRVWPLFGIAHRITDRPIAVEGGGPGGGATTLPAGTVLCFDYTALHHAGVASPGRFDPDRWLTTRARDLPSYLPFGVPRNRPCPAQALCMAALPHFATALAAGLRLWSPGVEHSRSLPGCGLALLQLRGGPPPSRRSLALLSACLRGVDLADALRISLTQLVCGTLLVLQARTAALAQRYHALGLTPRGSKVPQAQR